MTNAIASISFGMGCVGMLVAIFMFRKYHIDRTRDDLFRLRDALTLFSYDHGLIESTAYRNLRQLINLLIRYTHRLSLSRLILLTALSRVFNAKAPISPAYTQWKDSVASLSARQREELERIHAAALTLMVKHVIRNSPLLWAVALWVGFGITIRQPNLNRVKSSTLRAMVTRAPTDLLEEDAYAGAV